MAAFGDEFPITGADGAVSLVFPVEGVAFKIRTGERGGEGGVGLNGSSDRSGEIELRAPSYGLTVSKFREVSRSRINRELAAGALVVCADDRIGLDYGHIITVVGDLGDRYKVVDPAWCK